MKTQTTLLFAALIALTACTPHLDTPTDTLSWALGQNAAQSIMSSEIPNLNHDRIVQAVNYTIDKKAMPTLKNQSDTISWAIGESTVQNLLSGPIPNLNLKLFEQALSRTLKGNTSLLTPAQYDQAITKLEMATKEAFVQAEAKANEAQEQYFAQLVANEPTTQRHPSGFYYQPITKGRGANATIGQRILFNFRSYHMLTGQPINQSTEPILHVVGNPMFPGLIDAFLLMNAGSTYRFYFPFQVAYGARATNTIPPFTPLIYEIELIKTFDN